MGKSVIRVIWASTMVLVPLFGIWLASSIAAYRNASTGLVVLAGLLLFPILPVGWDLIFLWRRDPAAKAILTRLDRLVLRTLIVNGLFLGGMFWFAPQTAFRAIAVRGDWFLDGHDGDVANAIRSAILDFADHFSSRWHETETTYGTSDKAPDTVVPPPPPPPAPAPTDDETETETHAPTKLAPPREWPMDPAIDPAVRDMPDPASIEVAGAYLTSHFADPKQRVKAIHDFVALRLTYDYDTLAKLTANQYASVPSQEAKAVFAARTGVCEGYARLTAALGKAAGIDIKYITGYIRDTRRRPPDTGTDAAIKAALEGYLHAWNAVQLDGKWQLLDVTWDDPKEGDIETTYLFTPPSAFIRDHLPDDKKWQLLEKPLSVGEFARQPFMTPLAAELEISLEQPTRSQVTVDGELTIVVDNPRHLEVQGESRPQHPADGKLDKVTCDSRERGAKVEITCKLPAGEHEVLLYAGERHVGGYQLAYVGSILANAR